MSVDPENTGELLTQLGKLAREVTAGLALETSTVSGAALIQEAVKAAGRTSLVFRRACKAKSRSEYAEALPEVILELEEVSHWLNLILDAGVLAPERVEPLMEQTKELSGWITIAQRSVSSSSGNASSASSATSSSSSSRRRSVSRR